MKFVSRYFLIRFIILSVYVNLIIIIPSMTDSATAEIVEKHTSIGKYFDGEEFTYNIGFWWFKKAAICKILIHRLDDGTYKITLQAETLGIIGLITKYRKDVYTTYVEEVEEGKRFRTTKVEKIITIGDKVRRGYTIIDYNKKKYIWKSWGGGKEDRGAEEPLPASGYYDDPFTGFYNFRFGVYGKIEEGNEFYVPTFPVKGVSNIHIRIATKKEKSERTNLNNAEVGYVADVVIDRELFGSQTGNVEIQFTKDIIPIKATAKDLILFGDVEGILVDMTSKLGFRKIMEGME